MVTGCRFWLRTIFRLSPSPLFSCPFYLTPRLLMFRLSVEAPLSYDKSWRFILQLFKKILWGQKKKNKKKLLFPKMQLTKKAFSRSSQKNFIINLIKFSKQMLHLKDYYSSTFLCWKTKSPFFYSLKGKNVNSHE